MPEAERSVGQDTSRIGASIRTGEPPQSALLELGAERLWTPGLALPLPPRIEYVDGIRHVHLRDSRAEELEHFLEMAKRLQLPVEIGQATVFKKEGDWPAEYVKAQADEIVHGTPQSLTNGGVSLLWEYALGNGTATADQTLTLLTNARAALGVGDSTTAFAATQNDLQAASNKLRKAMDSTYPQHTDGTTSGAQTITFQSTFATGDANFAWQEWVVANSATAATGRLLNRKVESLGTKVSTATWVLQITITIS